MYNSTKKFNDLDLLIESTKEEFNDYAESLLSEYAFDEVKPLLESAHFEAELIITEAEDAQADQIKKAVEDAKDKIENKLNSPEFNEKCKKIEEAIKADPSIGEQMVEVPDVAAVAKKAMSLAKSGTIKDVGVDEIVEQLNEEIERKTKEIKLAKLMILRRGWVTILLSSVAMVGAVVTPMIFDGVISTGNIKKNALGLISSLVTLAAAAGSVISAIPLNKLYRQIHKLSDDIDAARDMMYTKRAKNIGVDINRGNVRHDVRYRDMDLYN